MMFANYLYFFLHSWLLIESGELEIVLTEAQRKGSIAR
jgi:hypothetical protein